MKKIWITALDTPEQSGATAQALMAVTRSYGLETGGHFWTDDLKTMAWLGPLESLTDRDTAVWIILGSRKNLESSSVRYGLGLLALSVQAKKGFGFPIFFLDTGEGIDVSALPFPLRGVDILPAGNTALGAKLAAKANLPLKPFDPGYRMNIHASEHFGVWFEIGPSGDAIWNGALLGTAGGVIDFHGAGPAGSLPQKAVLEYPMQGLKLELKGREYAAWAVQNTFDRASSYYVRVREIPFGIVFGPLEQGENEGFFSIDF
jgi:hypothetical protein